MGFLLSAPERKAAASSNYWDVLREFLNAGAQSASGKTINKDTALQTSAVLACCRVYANGLAQVPCKVFQESDDGRVRLPAKDHPLYMLLHRRPNPWQTSYEYRETLAVHLVLAGNHFAFKNRVLGKIVELIPFEPQCVRVKLGSDGIELLYTVTMPNGRTQDFPAETIWHVRGMSWNGWLGLDPVRLARESIGLSLAIEEQAAKMQANGLSSPGVYSVEGEIDETQYEQLRRFIKENYAGANRGLPMILDRAAKWLPLGMTGVDAQHLESRKFQVQEICRQMGVMPIMVGLDDKSQTYASAEQMFTAHVVHTLAPMYERVQQSADVYLLGERDMQAGYYVKFIAQGLMRGAMKDQAEYFAKALGSGGAPAWMAQDEVRELLELNPMGGAAAQLPIATNVPKPAPEPTA